MRKVLLGVFVVATFAMAPVFAASNASSSHEMAGHELLFGSNSLVVPVTVSPFGVTMSAAIGYQRAVMPNVQLGVRGSMGVATTAQDWQINGWATYNIDEKWNDSIFIGAGIGMKYTAATGFINPVVGVEGGKRFEICHNLTWRPNIAWNKTLDGSAAAITVNVVNLSYMW
jgi:hypothetical protein